MNTIGFPSQKHEPLFPSVSLAALEPYLSDDEIETICRQLGYGFRHRLLPPGTLVRSIIYRSLHPDKSIRSTLADLIAQDRSLPLTLSDAAWCQARSRLPQDLWSTLLRQSVQRVDDLVGDRYRTHDRPIYLVDGSTVSMPDEPELVEAFGYADTKHGPSRFPVARVMFITRAGAQTVVDYRIDPYRTDENAQFHAMWHQLPNGAICLADRHFSSFYNLAKLTQRGIDFVSRLHQRRSPARLIRQGRAIGKEEWIVPLTLAAQLRKKYNDSTLPKVVWVRLIHVCFSHQGHAHELWLITTLLDTRRYPRTKIIELYQDRWEIETRIGSLKTTLKMAVLRSKKVHSLKGELAATILAHNLTWTLIHQAATLTRTPAERISFAGTLKIILTFSPILQIVNSTQRPGIYRRMLYAIALQRNPDRPGRIEPRLIKRQTKRYGFLKTTRQEARKCLS